MNAFHVGDALYVTDATTANYAVTHETVGAGGLVVGLNATTSVTLSGYTTTVAGGSIGHG